MSLFQASPDAMRKEVLRIAPGLAECMKVMFLVASACLSSPRHHGPNSFHFMQFLENRILTPPGGLALHLGEMLDPPLPCDHARPVQSTPSRPSCCTPCPFKTRSLCSSNFYWQTGGWPSIESPFCFMIIFVILSSGYFLQN